MKPKQDPRLEIPPELKEEIEHTKVVEILDLPYLHLKTAIGDDMYVTDSGMPFWRELLPRNFARDRQWFNAVKVPLPGSSTIFRIPLKDRAEEVVFKWNRMGTDPMIPGSQTPFNSPFEEFSLISELQSRLSGSFNVQQPLAIYVPSERHTLEALQRRRSLMDFLSRTQPDEHIDMHRDYAVIYRWVEGEDLYEHVQAGKLSIEEAELKSKAVAKMMDDAGYAVTDHKMSHIISNISADKAGFEDFTVIDFELLHRTAKHEYTIRKLRRQRYFVLRRKESRTASAPEPPENCTMVFGLPYLETETGSSGGRLWVAGTSEELIDYFVPEKWQTTPRQRLSRSGGTYLTTTKDNIKIVVKESRVGDCPVYDPLHEKADDAVFFGYNSPFEEAAVSAAMERAGLPATRLLAIYLMNQVYSVADYRKDTSRYDSHRSFLGTGGGPVLREDRQYLTLWQYWEGSVEEMLMYPRGLYEPVNLLMAYHRGIVNRKEYESILRFTEFKLSTKGFHDLAGKSTHIIILLNREGALVRDETGMPLYRYCNFSLMEKPAEE
jgi:hypothetical protein